MVDAHSVTQFHNEVHMSSLIDDLVEFHNIRVP
jgi:hypothetical protein